MNKTQFYLSQCAAAASKSPMCFTLGAILVKGGKVISSGHNHHRPHYDGAEVRTHGHRKVSFRARTRLLFHGVSLPLFCADTKPVSMHAEMHAIFSVTGMSPSFKTQVQGMERRVSPGQTQPPTPTKGPKGRAGFEASVSEPTALPDALCDDFVFGFEYDQPAQFAQVL